MAKKTMGFARLTAEQRKAMAKIGQVASRSALAARDKKTAPIADAKDLAAKIMRWKDEG